MSIATLLQAAKLQLECVSDSPLLDAQLLLAHILKKDRSYLLAWSETTPTAQQQQQFQSFLQQRLNGIPIAYILGTKEFWSMDFSVTPDVLIPRPETELLVEKVIEACVDIESPTILELGTGSGAIAIALAKELPQASITATDLSTAALAVAQRNAKHHHMQHIHFIQSNWFTDIPKGRFDIIVSNPPYIEKHDPHLQKEIKHEPIQALVSGKDGLDDIRIIVENANLYLKKHGKLLIEHGYNQGSRTREIMQQAKLEACNTVKDYASNDRITIGSSPP